jgi:hypothetical protein
MVKRMSVLLASTMTVAGLAAGVNPAHAATKPETYVGEASSDLSFGGYHYALVAQADCEPINSRDYPPARSAINSSTSSIITFYANRIFALATCFTEITVLRPGQKDNGFGTKLGQGKAHYYSST